MLSGHLPCLEALPNRHGFEQVIASDALPVAFIVAINFATLTGNAARTFEGVPTDVVRDKVEQQGGDAMLKCVPFFCFVAGGGRWW